MVSVSKAMRPATQRKRSMTLHNYKTGAVIRTATTEEWAASMEAAKHDGGVGVIHVDGQSVYVDGNPPAGAGEEGGR
jgi:hypothetical protein